MILNYFILSFYFKIIYTINIGTTIKKVLLIGFRGIEM
jgi:hypothetical protein